MTRARIAKEEILENGHRFLAICVETRNSVLVLLSETEDQLGTLAASVPPTTEMRTQPLLSSILLGDRNTVIARMLAERLASKTGKIGLVSVYLRTVDEREANPTLIKLFEKAVNESRSTEPTESESIRT